MHIGLKPKLISLKLFLDMVLSSYADIGRALRGCFLGGFLYVSFSFSFSFQSEVNSVNNDNNVKDNVD